MYYNTTNETPDQVKKFTKINNGQDKKVLQRIMQINKPFGASYIYLNYDFFESAPLTSIRRSINTLKNLDYIEETGNKTEGMYGRWETQYKLSK